MKSLYRFFRRDPQARSSYIIHFEFSFQVAYSEVGNGILPNELV